MDKANDEEAGRLRKDLHDLNQRFAMLRAGATQRVSTMNDALRLAKQFRDHYEPALAWLDGAEKRVSGLESVGIEPAQIQEDIEEHKVSAFSNLRSTPSMSYASLPRLFLFSTRVSLIVPSKVLYSETNSQVLSSTCAPPVISFSPSFTSVLWLLPFVLRFLTRPVQDARFGSFPFW